MFSTAIPPPCTLKSLTLSQTTLAKQFLERLYENGHSLQLWSLSEALPTFATLLNFLGVWWFFHVHFDNTCFFLLGIFTLESKTAQKYKIGRLQQKNPGKNRNHNIRLQNLTALKQLINSSTVYAVELVATTT